MRPVLDTQLLTISGLQREQDSRIWGLGKFVLAQSYAIALTNHYRQRKTGKYLGSLFAQIVSSFEDACKARARSKFRNRLRLKRSNDPTTCCVQFRRNPFRYSEPRGKHEMNWIDLGALLPPSCRQALRWVPVRHHRPLPPGSKVTQIAVTRDRISWHAVVTIQCDEALIAKRYPEANGRIAGINPSRNVAFTVVPADSRDFGQSDGRMFTAPSDPKKLLKRVAKLMRKADRQGEPQTQIATDRMARSLKDVHRLRLAATFKKLFANWLSFIPGSRRFAPRAIT